MRIGHTVGTYTIEPLEDPVPAAVAGTAEAEGEREPAEALFEHLERLASTGTA